MGSKGLQRATEVAILNANYMAKQLSNYYHILYANSNGEIKYLMCLKLQFYSFFAEEMPHLLWTK